MLIYFCSGLYHRTRMFSHSKYFHFLPRPRENVSASRDTEIQLRRLYQRAKPRGKATSHLIRIEKTFPRRRRTFSFGVNRKVLLTTHFARKWRRCDAKRNYESGAKEFIILDCPQPAKFMICLLGVEDGKPVNQWSTSLRQRKGRILPDSSSYDGVPNFSRIFPAHFSNICTNFHRPIIRGKRKQFSCSTSLMFHIFL